MRALRGPLGPLAAITALGLLAASRELDVVLVRGRSMAPALLPGDRLIVVRLHRAPRPGEVVLAPDPRDPRRELVKRVGAVDATGVRLRGDDPSWSTDARIFGSIPPATVRWRALARYWPPGRAGRIAPAPPLQLLDEGGEPACAFPESLIAG